MSLSFRPPMPPCALIIWKYESIGPTCSSPRNPSAPDSVAEVPTRISVAVTPGSDGPAAAVTAPPVADLARVAAEPPVAPVPLTLAAPASEGARSPLPPAALLEVSPAATPPEVFDVWRSIRCASLSEMRGAHAAEMMHTIAITTSGSLRVRVMSSAPRCARGGTTSCGPGGPTERAHLVEAGGDADDVERDAVTRVFQSVQPCEQCGHDLAVPRMLVGDEQRHADDDEDAAERAAGGQVGELLPLLRRAGD